MFNAYLSRWNLIPDGSPIATQSGRLLPVRRRGEPAMLKLAAEEEERFGVVLWNGGMATEPRGCWPATTSLLLERAEGAASLADMARNGRDDEACQVLPLTRRAIASHKTSRVSEELHRRRACRHDLGGQP